MKKVKVWLGKRTYQVIIGEKLSETGKYLKKLGFTNKVFVVTNSVVKKHYFKTLLNGLERAGFEVLVSTIPDGEHYKTLDTIQKLYADAAKAGIDRKTPVIALGGGVVGDICGFFAATYLRGLPFIQLPTTLLSMVDSSVGGKTGVDLKEGKNLVGAFYQPKLVLIDVSTLKTLPQRQLKNGLAEVIKYGVIKDKNFFKFLKANITLLSTVHCPLFTAVISRCIQIKADVVSKDEYETKGLREILNFGHTFGHAIENLMNYKKYFHGEAVAIGMVMAAELGVKLGMFSEREKEEIRQLVLKAGLPVVFDFSKFKNEKVLAVLARDKKVVDKRFRFVIPEKIGRTVIHNNVPVNLIQEVIK